MRLEARYDRFFASMAAGDRRAAREHLEGIVGLELPADEQGGVEPVRAAMLRYDKVRDIDVVALLGGARRAAKFEDLSRADALGLARRLEGAGLHVVQVGPYTKRFDVTVSRDGAAPRADRFVVLASRGHEAAGIAEAERDRGPDGARRAGLLLGYPPCCVERFVEVSLSTETDREGINEATFRDFVGEGRLPWQLNPLSALSPVGFTPCMPGCPAALAFAEGVLGAAASRGAAQARLIAETLSRPVLFLRFPLFWVLGGAEVAGARVRFALAAMNDDGARGLEPLRAMAHDTLGRLVTRGGELALEGGVLALRGASEQFLRCSDPLVPRLLRFTSPAP